MVYKDVSVQKERLFVKMNDIKPMVNQLNKGIE